MLVDADGVVGVFVAGIRPQHCVARALEIAERRAAPGIEQRLDGRIRMLRRVMDLRHVVHRRHAIIELAQAAEQLVDVNVLRTIHRRELQQNEFEVSRVPARRVGPVIDENPVVLERVARGEARGKIEGLQESILSILAVRFSVLAATPQTLQALAHFQDVEKLKQLQQELLLAPDEPSARALLQLPVQRDLL